MRKNPVPTPRTSSPSEMSDLSDSTCPDVNVTKPSTCSSILPRPRPSVGTCAIYLDCVICGSNRVWSKVLGKYIREKFRICTIDRAQAFLGAIKYHKDEVYIKCANLYTPDDVYAADLYYHKSCFDTYKRIEQCSYEETTA